MSSNKLAEIERQLDLRAGVALDAIECFSSCGATDKPLDNSWGPFCGESCKAISELEADRAAADRYI